MIKSYKLLFDNKCLKLIKEIKNNTSMCSNADVIRSCLRLSLLIRNKIKKGCKVIIKDPKGKDSEIILFNEVI